MTRKKRRRSWRRRKRRRRRGAARLGEEVPPPVRTSHHCWGSRHRGPHAAIGDYTLMGSRQKEEEEEGLRASGRGAVAARGVGEGAPLLAERRRGDVCGSRRGGGANIRERRCHWRAGVADGGARGHELEAIAKKSRVEVVVEVELRKTGYEEKLSAITHHFGSASSIFLSRNSYMLNQRDS
jgi:hypothetical protein